MSTTKREHSVHTTHKAHVFAPRGVQIVAHPATHFQAHPNQTAHFRVSVDPGLGQKGTAVADSLLQTCEQDFLTLQGYFGDITPPSMPFQLIVTSGNEGASHATCAATALSIGANSGALPFMRSLVIAEEDEVFEAAFGGLRLQQRRRPVARSGKRHGPRRGRSQLRLTAGLVGPPFRHHRGPPRRLG